jgi:hypothetical protein
MITHIAILTANQYRFALGGIEKGGQPLFGVGGGYRTHRYILDKLDKTDNRRDSLNAIDYRGSSLTGLASD